MRKQYYFRPSEHGLLAWNVDRLVTQDADVPGWLTLGQVTIVSSPAKPSLRGSFSVSGFDLIVRNAAPGMWTVAVTTNLTDWTPLLSTNTSTSDWSVTDKESAAARFYRVVGSGEHPEPNKHQ